MTKGAATVLLRADSMSRALTVAFVSDASCSSIRAAVAATMGEAMDVPDIS